MHMRTFIYWTFGIALFPIWGCGDQSEHDGRTEEVIAVPAQHERVDEAETPSLPKVTLENGQRWKANPETTSGIANMVALIDNQIASPGNATEAKAAIEDEFALIFERCTMTGEAHNQLHNYLIPIHQRLSGFDAGDTTQLAEMKSYLNSYTQYFE